MTPLLFQLRRKFEIIFIKDGAINFKEFQKHAILENEYEMFDMNDTDNDQLLSLEEYRNFSKEGPARDASGPILTQYNFNTKTVE